MKKRVMLLALALLLAAACQGCSSPASGALPPAPTTAAVTADEPSVAPSATAAGVVYKDGVYEYQSTKDYESYFVKGVLTIKNGKISAVEWAIYDAGRQDKLFDKDYEAVFTGNENYIQQCRDNLKGMEGYAQALIDSQNIEDVDVVTGATWAHKFFELFVNEALEQARQK